MSKRGFTLIELLVVIAIIAILASILFPVFAKAREKARQTQCTNNVRQLALAVNMYVQDNGSRFPGVNATTFVGWDAEIESYVGSRQIYKCPSDPATETQTPVSYGYNGLLVAPNGRGCNESQVKSPTEVGVVCDGTPTAQFGAGALIGGGALSTDLAATVNPDPRHGGVLIGYADGHAKIAPGKKIELRDTSNGVSRAFYQAVGLGNIANYAGGIENTGATVFSSYGIGGGDQVFIGGDSAGSQILLAAADIFANLGGKVLNRGFKGFDAKGEWKRALDSGQYAWVVAKSGVDTGAANSVVIGYDAMVLVVAKNCRIPKVTQNNYTLTQTDIRSIFAEGYTANSVQCYTFPEYPSGVTADVFKSGSRKYFLRTVCAYPEDEITGKIDVNSVAVDTDEEVIDGVSGDPFGIGYVSASVADTERVRILKYNNGTTTFNYPGQNDRYATLVPYPMPNLTTEVDVTYYSFVRPLSLLYAGSGDKMKKVIQNVDFTSGPLFEASFWANE